jgi:large subunit ribosomal protein L24
MSQKSHRIRKNDMVKVLTGKYKGKVGRVLRTFPDSDRAVVEGVNLIKKHARATGQRQQQGGIIEKEGPIHISNLMVVCEKTKEPTRVGVRRDSEGHRQRYSKKAPDTLIPDRL